MADFDIAVIGAGSAGLSVSYAATQLGLKVALIERDRRTWHEDWEEEAVAADHAAAAS